MARLIIFIIYIIFGLLFGGRSRYRGYGYYSYSRRDYNDLSDWIQTNIKRFIAVKKAKVYISKYQDSYSLRNKNVTLIYNYRAQSIACMNIKNRKENFKVNWENYKEISYMTISDDVLKNSFSEAFNQLCIRFNDDITYEMILEFYQDNYNVENKTDEEQKIKQSKRNQAIYVDEYYDKQEIPKKLININTANIDELKSLPGINIVIAKRIIKYRNDNKDGFKTKDEFYKEFNIKPHFIKQINDIIYTGIKDYNYKSIEQDEEIIIDSIEPKYENDKDRIIDI